MENHKLTAKEIGIYKCYLKKEEKSENTVQKYVRDVSAFFASSPGIITKESVIAYKNLLCSQGYKAQSINSMLASLNSFFAFMGWNDLTVRSLKLQRKIYCEESREISRGEYERLCRTAERKGKERLSLIIQTICGTGIRVSELEYVTVEAVRRGEAVVSLKGKTRTVLIVRDLQKKLMRYIANRGIGSGAVFITGSGKPVDRSNVWREMKSLCRDAGVDPSKVFPHNLRHLFARIFYAMDRDIAKLADILGHSSIETTRLYIITTVKEHRRQMENMRLII